MAEERAREREGGIERASERARTEKIRESKGARDRDWESARESVREKDSVCVCVCV